MSRVWRSAWPGADGTDAAAVERISEKFPDVGGSRMLTVAGELEKAWNSTEPRWTGFQVSALILDLPASSSARLRGAPHRRRAEPVATSWWPASAPSA